MRSRIPQVLVVIGMVVVVAIVCTKLWSAPSLRNEADRAIACFVAHDAACLWRLVPPEEAEAYGLNETTFIKFYQDFVEKPIGPITLVEPPSFLASEGTASESGSILYKSNTSGRKGALDLTIYASAKGPLAGGLVWSLIAGRFQFDSDPLRPMPRGVDRLAWYSKEITFYRGQLEGLGVRGKVETDPQTGEPTLIPWDRVVESYQQTIKKATSGK